MVLRPAGDVAELSTPSRVHEHPGGSTDMERLKNAQCILRERLERTRSYRGFGVGYWMERYPFDLYDPYAHHMILPCLVGSE